MCVIFLIVERKETQEFFNSGEVNFQHKHDKKFTGIKNNYEK